MRVLLGASPWSHGMSGARIDQQPADWRLSGQPFRRGARQSGENGNLSSSTHTIDIYVPDNEGQSGASDAISGLHTAP